MYHSLPDIFNGRVDEDIHICRLDDAFRHTLAIDEEVALSPLIKPLSDSEILSLEQWILEKRSMTEDPNDRLPLASPELSRRLPSSTNKTQHDRSSAAHGKEGTTADVPQCLSGTEVNRKLAQPLVSSVFALECLRYVPPADAHQSINRECSVSPLVAAKYGARTCCTHPTLLRSRC